MPAQISALEGVHVVHLSAGAGHAAAVSGRRTATSAPATEQLGFTASGELYTWGQNSDGQLGYEATDGAEFCSVPMAVETLSTPISKVACGAGHTLATTAIGGLWSWGSGSDGQLGHGPEQMSSSVVPCCVQALVPEVCTEVAAGEAFSVVVSDVGTIWSWGKGLHGELGRKSSGSSWPSPVDALEKFVKIACANSHVLALAASREQVASTVYHPLRSALSVAGV